ncbi:MAG: TIGR02996 domain-containing protein [Archangium sp.]
MLAWARASASDRIVVPVRPRRAAPARNEKDEDELLAAIVAAPDDSSRRLVYADLLAERGDPLAELIRLQLSDENNPRIADILRANWSTFAGELAPYAGAHSFRRGFVERVSMTIAAFAKHGERLFSKYPLHELEIRQQYTPKQLEQLAKAPGLRLVKKLRLASIQLRPLAPLRTGNFASLRELVVFYCGVDAPDLETFFAEIDAPRLESLRVESQVEFPQAIRTGLARNKTLTALKQIQIGQGQ